ncbi:MAG: hypothetical protein JXR37_24095 [Kiritimatiellae bacterium]|nr:hypothetical protein [Kiritimatiellia bacterium]
MVFLVALFFCLALVNVWRHEMWRDELQAWLIAKDSGSVAELFRNMRYEGHPALWHAALFLLSRATPHPFAMQLLHAALATAAAALFLAFAPFSRLHKGLFVLGYFPLYEYNAISRNYAVGLLLLFAFCAGACRPQRRYVLLGLVLFLLCQANAYGLLIAVSMALLLGMELALSREVRRQARRRKWDVALAGGLVALGVTLSAVQLLPPADSGFAVGWHTTFDVARLRQMAATVWKSYVPLPRPAVAFWNTNILDPASGVAAAQVWLSPVLVCAGVWMLRRRPLVLVPYLFFTLAALTFTYVKLPGSLRHHGHLYLMLVACLWLAARDGRPAPEPAGGRPRRGKDWRRLVLTALLAVHAFAGIFACVVDWRHPFSAGKVVAGYLRKHDLHHAVLVGDMDYAVSPVAGYLNRKIYYPAADRDGSFIVWDNRRSRLSRGRILELALERAARQQKDAVLILNYKTRYADPRVEWLAVFDASIVPDERYVLFRVKGP